MNDIRYIRMRKYEDDSPVHCGPLHTWLGIAMIVMIIAVPVGIISHRAGFVQGVQSGVMQAEYVIDESIKSGGWFAFHGGQIKIVKTVRQSKKISKRVQMAAAIHDAEHDRIELVRYRAMQAYGPDTEQSFEVKF